MTSRDHRQEIRYPFHWRVAIVFGTTEHQAAYHGVTDDISKGGCAVLTEHNISSAQPVSVFISLPVEKPGTSPTVVEIKARLVYTVLASRQRNFRCGIQFLSFKGDGRADLTKALAMRDPPLATP